MNLSPTYIDLFAGAGGLSEGFIRAGYEPLAHVESDEAACFTLKTRLAFHYLRQNSKIEIYQKYLKGEINRQTLYSFVPEELFKSVINKKIGSDNRYIFSQINELIGEKRVDLIIGGPPCQAYSLVGRARDENGMQEDKRNKLYLQYNKFIREFKPKFFVFENVPGLLSANNGDYYKHICHLFKNKKEYSIKDFELHAQKFGVLQNRKRILIIGYRNDLGIEIPDLEKFDSGIASTVSSIFNDLPKLKDGDGTDKFMPYNGKTNDWLNQTGIRTDSDILTQHITRPHTEQDKKIYKIAVKKWDRNRERLDYNDLPEELKTHRNRHSFFDRFKVVAGDSPFSHTVVAHIAKDGHYYIHPDIKQNRSLSVREAARLQSFPDNFYFEGVKETRNRTSAYKQIGNAVPTLMAFFIAEKLKSLL